MPAAGVVLIIGVVLVIGAAAAFLLPTIAALIAITRTLDEAIANVGELIAKSAPGQRGRRRHQRQSRRGR